MDTATRVKLTGPSGNATLVQVVPPLVERNTPSKQPARISAAGPPAGVIETDHVYPPFRWFQVTPPSVETYTPLVVAAIRWFVFPRSTTISKNPIPTNGVVQSVVQVVPPSVDRRTPAPTHQSALPSPVPQYTMLGFTGSKASAPTVSVAAKSVRGAQLPPRSKLSQTPPP